ncbi:MAG: hypothetical protein JST55_17020 [Bacteroidetes bacterium]|nr:hypothetical protein [Bacteroidota bacterium]
MHKLLITSLFSIIIILMLFCDSYSQNGVRKKIFDAQKDAAYNFLTNANRPSPDFSSDMINKEKWALDIAGATDGNYPEVSVTGTYGLTDKINLSSTVTVFTTNYNLNGNKFTGFGDILLNSRFTLSEGEIFSHFAQVSVKIPTAKSDDQLGTGKPDYHAGLIGNYSKENLSIDLSASLDMLGRPDFPVSNKKLPAIVQQEIDSVKQFYDFTFQPNYSISFYPTYAVSDNVSLSAGIDFSRDMKLNSNSSTFYLGLGYDFSDKASFSFGSDFNIINSSDYNISGDLTLSF